MNAPAPSGALPGQPRTAVVVFNLGGPDRPDAVRPFLFNLFRDPLILRLPDPLRTALAWLLAWRRAPTAGAIYERLGGGSPLLPNTEAQAAALEAQLGGQARVFVAMRYWHPMAPEVVEQVRAWGAERVVLLPLYPQFSTTTVASFRRVWDVAAKAAGWSVPTVMVCCWPTETGFVEAYAGQVRAAVTGLARGGVRPRVLFSAHGLPEQVVRAGDPYQWQCERTAAAIAEATGLEGLDWVSCYQSRVGPLKWIGPSTEAEIERAAADRVPVVVAPIAFVSEHSETLFEIEIEYRELAHRLGVPGFARVPTPGTNAVFIAGLAGMVRQALAAPGPLLCPEAAGRLCPAPHHDCPWGRMKDRA